MAARSAIVRFATVADFDAIVAVFDACWAVSYRGVLPDDVIATMTPAATDALWQRVLAAAGADEVLVAELPRSNSEVAARGVGVDDCGGVVGVARWEVTASDGAPDRAGWLHSLYVDPRCQGAGVGGVLLAAVEERLVAAGATAAHLWAFAANDRARRFYAAHGWTVDGTTRVEEQFGEPEVRFTKRLPTAVVAGDGR